MVRKSVHCWRFSVLSARCMFLEPSDEPTRGVNRRAVGSDRALVSGAGGARGWSWPPADRSEDLRSKGKLDLSECFIDAAFVAAKRGGCAVGNTKRGKGTKLVAVAERAGLPIAVYTASASPHEITLVQDALAQSHVAAQPAQLIGDRAYDGDGGDIRPRRTRSTTCRWRRACSTETSAGRCPIRPGRLT